MNDMKINITFDIFTLKQNIVSSIIRKCIEATLREEGITMIDDYEDLTEDEKSYLEDYFTTEVYPVVTPMAVDSSRPFPLILNKSLNIGALLTRKENAGPGILNRTKKAKKAMVWS